MKIRTSGQTGEGARRVLSLLVEQPSATVLRPCPGCVKPCACPRNATDCGCGCSPACPDAARALSSDPARYPVESLVVPLVFAPDPARYPVESLVVPLVFALAELRLAVPCWSCEGHLTVAGEWVRVPQVWFYAEDAVLTELLARHLASLRDRGVVEHLWEITVSPYSACEVTTFVIRPVIDPGADARSELERLQQGLPVLASGLRASTLAQARSRLKR